MKNCASIRIRIKRPFALYTVGLPRRKQDRKNIYILTVDPVK